MLSIKRAKDDAYFTQSEKHDYYSQGASLVGEWFGNGAKHFRLTGAIEPQAFQNLFYGFSPKDKTKPLVQNAGRWQRQVQRNGRTVTEERRHAWDLTFSAPKSGSLLWALVPAPLRTAIAQCHRDAIQTVLTWAEAEFGQMRRGRNGVHIETAQWIVGLFQHGSSRELDPQLHTHCCLMAVGITASGDTGQIDSYDLYRHKRLLGAAYRAELAKHLQQRFSIALRPHKAARVCSFEIDGIPQAVLDAFSKRAQQIETAMRSQGYDGSHPKVAERLALMTRQEKQQIDPQALFERWQQQAEALGFGQTAALRVIGRLERWEPDWGVEQQQTIEAALTTLTQQRSHFARYDLLRSALEQAQCCGIGFQGSLAAVDDWIANAPVWQQRPEQVVVLGERQGAMQYSTQAMVDLERAMLAQVKHLSELSALSVDPELIQDAIAQRQSSERPLRSDQEAALRTLTTASGRIKVLTGVPGAGKTEVLGVASQVWRQAGYRLVGLNFQGRTAADLEQKTGIPSDTIHKTLSELEKGEFAVEATLSEAMRSGRATAKQQQFYQYQVERLRYQIDDRTIVILDEGSMVDTPLLKRIADVVAKAGAQWILAGDAQHLPSIGPGGGFAAIAERVPCAVLSEPVRQQVDWQRDQTKHLAAGEVETAIRTYHQRGRLRVEATPDLTRSALIADWQQHGIQQPKDAAIVAMTNVEVAAYNQVAQVARLQAGAIGGSCLRVNGTCFYEKDRILFRRRETEEGIVPFRRYGVRNGQFATIEQIRSFEAEMSIRLDSSMRLTIPVAEFPHFRLGYAGTTYFFQGESVAQTFIQVGGTMQDLEQTLVQLTRHRLDARLYTDWHCAREDLNLLLRQMQRSRQKQLAVQVQAQNWAVQRQAKQTDGLVP